MEFVNRIFSGLLGGGKTPAASTEAVTDVSEDEEKAKKARSALYATKGGVSGEEVSSVSTSGRSTLFGN